MSKIGQDVKVLIRELQGVDEMVAAETVQKTVWESKSDYDHKDILIAIQHAGGLVAGAFTDDGSLVGFILAFPTMSLHGLHSHRLAVLPAYRHQGLGEKLKWFQRTWGIERGIEWIRWTFDPLLVMNANLNIHRLGGISTEYLENYYGSMDGINTGTPSDRIMVVWYLQSQRVLDCLTPNFQDNGYPEAIPINQVNDDSIVNENLDLDSSTLRLNLPHDIVKLSIADLSLSMEWRFHVRRILQHYFKGKYSIIDFTRIDGPAYILQKG